MNQITKEGILQGLFEAYPPYKQLFESDKNFYYADDGELLLYIVASDIADELVKLFQQDDKFSLKKIFDFIELLFEKGDDYVKELATVGFLEDIQNHAGWAEIDPRVLVPYLGPQSKKAWEDVEDFWSGRAPLIGVSWEELAKAKLKERGVTNPSELDSMEEILKLMKEQKRAMQGGYWTRIVNFFNTPIKRYGLNGEELIDPSPRIPMIWSVPIILGGAILVLLLLLIYFAFIAQ